ncbi:unnamed protein product, partial [Linum tenue]
AGTLTSSSLLCHCNSNVSQLLSLSLSFFCLCWFFYLSSEEISKVRSDQRKRLIRPTREETESSRSADSILVSGYWSSSFEEFVFLYVLHCVQFPLFLKKVCFISFLRFVQRLQCLRRRRLELCISFHTSLVDLPLVCGM